MLVDIVLLSKHQQPVFEVWDTKSQQSEGERDGEREREGQKERGRARERQLFCVINPPAVARPAPYFTVTLIMLNYMAL